MMGTVFTAACGRTASPRSLHKTLLPLFAAAIIILLSVSASAQVVSADFEDGGNDGFFGFGGPTLTNVNGVANTGLRSLLTTNRTATFNGPGISLTTTLAAGQTYVFKVAVKLQNAPTNGTGDNVNMTMLNTVNGATGFANVAGGTVTNNGWTLLQGTYTVPTSGVSNLILYVEDDTDGTASYYIDTFSGTLSSASNGCSNPPDNSGFLSNFDDGTTQGWFGRGAAGVSLTNDSHSGAASLLVQGRTMFWNGAAKDITGKMCNGQQYWVEAWVKMAPGQPATSLNLSLQYTDAANQTHFPGVATSAAPVTDSQWVRLKSKPYTFSGSYTDLQIYVQSTPSEQPDSNGHFASFEVDDVKVVFLPPPTIENLQPIAQTYAGDFPLGFAAVDSDILGVHGQLAAKHYNSVTPGNDLKWDTTEPSEGNFNFAPADGIVSWAQAHGIRVRGHNFVWHNQVPNWVWIDPVTGKDMSTEPYSDANKAVLLGRLKNHINGLINHYYGPSSTFGNTIYVWDVVNEAIDDGNPANFRKSKWYQITVDPNNNPGYPEYMDDAFIWARAALDSFGFTRDKVELCYNDYNTTIPAKGQFIYNWVKGAIGRGVPIDCVGNQFHNNITFPVAGANTQSVVQTINLFNSLTATSGKPIQNEVTEFDISLYQFGNCGQTFYFDYDDILALDKRNLALEGYLYSEYFQTFRSLRNKIDSVTIWGLGDDDSWLNPSSNTAGCNGVRANDAPLPFDSYLQHKDAYTGLTNPSQLPGAGLSASIASKTGAQNARTWTIAVSNPGPGTAYNAEVTSFTLTQTSGAACTPVVTPPAAYPIALGDLASGASANAAFTIDFTGCAALARFTMKVNYDSSSGSNPHSLTLANQFR